MEVEINNNVDVSNYQEKIQEIMSRSKDLSEPLKAFSVYYRGQIQSNYYGEGKYFDKSGKWRALSEKYAKLKSKKYPGKKILRLTDRLMNAAFGKSSEGKTIIDKDSVNFVIDNIEYSNVHQYGFENIPERPYLFHYSGGLTKKDSVFLLKLLEKYIIGDNNE